MGRTRRPSGLLEGRRFRDRVDVRVSGGVGIVAAWYSFASTSSSAVKPASLYGALRPDLATPVVTRPRTGSRPTAL